MNFFHLFRRKSHKTIARVEENNIEKIEHIKEKIAYQSDTLLTDVLRYIKSNSLNIGVHLNKPATDIEIETFEDIKMALPDDFKLLYKFSNGFETEHDLFRLIPLEEIIESKLNKNYLANDNSFHFTEYMIYSDMWSVDISKENINDYCIYNKAEDVVYLTNSLAEFLCVFINKGIYDGLYEWREIKQRNNK
ncbi:SMI1/KNR4 family protein [Ferruginibacter albus]|uniref:SMI1/KNR4 family protein n=1 Tax=Ferruginibacter albus TaxID=2875540 RepID=UPI001CC796CC|nr:SMI1/KNR4 family protein [Ferruginibacter albus]UAY53043.1 SMI1/KNR4 family protein [Ferruginibacter albus]